MNSEGTIFTDFDGPILFREYGVYTQLQKKFLEDKLKFTGSIRYDKSQNFDGQFSPRVSFVYTTGERRNHNFRVSYQTGFRNPTTQDQYIGLNLGPFALIGSAEDNLDR
ncbi:TonB-dependent receptor, partial [Arthrospira platensis SPKY2]